MLIPLKSNKPNTITLRIDTEMKIDVDKLNELIKLKDMANKAIKIVEAKKK